MATCKSCGDDFSQLGTHWRYNSEHRPELSAEQHEVVEGVLVGDGYVSSFGGQNALLQVCMANKDYLQHLDTIFGNLGTGVKFNQDQGGNHETLYQFRTRRHPELNKYEEWYENGEKSIPSDLELTPTILKHWYCGDGTLSKGEAVEISAAADERRVEVILNLFDQAGLPEPRVNDGSSTYNDSVKKFRFVKSDSVDVFEFMGSPPPGFEYKWVESVK